MAKILKYFFLALIGLFLVLIFRASLHDPIDAKATEEIDISLDYKNLADHLSESIKFKTISNQNPAAMNKSEFIDFQLWIKKTYTQFHNSLSLLKFNETLLYKWEGSNEDLKPILITGHYDVVPVIPGTSDIWDQPPFSGNIDSGFIWGRGALDDKSGVVGMLEAASYLLKSNYKPARTIYFSFGHDEEIGGVNGAALVTEYFKESNIKLAWSLDEGSFLLEGFFPGIDRPIASINVAEKGSLTLQIVGKAAGGHSSMPPRKSAIGHLSEAIVKLEANRLPGGLEGLSLAMFDEITRHMPFLYKLVFANRWLFGGLMDKQLSNNTFVNSMLRTTTAPTMLSGSIKTNILPIEAIATVNFRLHPRDSIADVINHVKNVVENDNIEVRPMSWGGSIASPVSSWNSKGFSIVGEAVKEIYGNVIVVPGLMVAGSDSKHYGKVADDAYRFNPFLLSTNDLAGFHGTNEKISIDTFAKGVKVYIRVIEKGSN